MSSGTAITEATGVWDAVSAGYIENLGLPRDEVVANIGNASNKGLEVQFDWAVSQNFTLGANATWLEAEMDEDVVVTIEHLGEGHHLFAKRAERYPVAFGVVLQVPPPDLDRRERHLESAVPGFDGETDLVGRILPEV